jgi:hypothetical protein
MKCLLLSLALLSCTIASAETKQPAPAHQFSVGLGGGLDYGGVGTRITYAPIKSVLVFAGVGYNLIGVGYNIGAGYRLLPDKRFSPYAVGIYGYNAVVTVTVNDQHVTDMDRTFYGATFGAGAELKRSRGRKNFWNFELLVPIRSKEFNDYKSELERNFNATFSALPIAFSIGYHIEF